MCGRGGIPAACCFALFRSGSTETLMLVLAYDSRRNRGLAQDPLGDAERSPVLPAAGLCRSRDGDGMRKSSVDSWATPPLRLPLFLFPFFALPVAHERIAAPPPVEPLTLGPWPLAAEEVCSRIGPEAGGRREQVTPKAWHMAG